MDSSSNTRNERYWPHATVLVLTLAAVPAYADDERRNTEKTPVTISSNNPCFGPADPVTDEHPGEPIEGPGTQETTTRETIKRDGTMETRTRTQISGRPVGAVSAVTYVYENDNTTNLRFRPNGATRFISRSREEGIPTQRVGVTGQNVPAFVVTTREEQVFDPAVPAKNKSTFERDEKCRDKKGRDRCHDEDRHDDHRDRD
jgi:hypothetical protein